jgi:hypothetical protein
MSAADLLAVRDLLTWLFCNPATDTCDNPVAFWVSLLLLFGCAFACMNSKKILGKKKRR